MKRRTLTNRSNQRPTWLGLAHRRLNHTVLDAFGWPREVGDDDILSLPLAPNLTRVRLVVRLDAMQLTADEIIRLSPQERLSLIEQLWDSLTDADIPLTSAQQSELERRLATFEDDRTQAVTWNCLHAELERRCP